jgi:hypothetical protein
MLRYAKTCVGKPFSAMAMARSLVWPRKTDGSSFFCAELVAAVLKEGGLLDPVSNPGAATPQGLHELYKGRATTTANPFLLRQANCQKNLTCASIVQERVYVPPPLHHRGAALATSHALHSQPSLQRQQAPHQHQHQTPVQITSIARGEYAPLSGAVRASNGSTTALRVLNAGSYRPHNVAPQQLGLTLNSLNFRTDGR